MPGGALTANTQMMRDNGTLNKFPEVIKAMQEVVVKGWSWYKCNSCILNFIGSKHMQMLCLDLDKIAPGDGRMVLGYFGKTPAEAYPEIIKLASEKLKLEPTKENLWISADEDPKKKMRSVLESKD